MGIVFKKLSGKAFLAFPDMSLMLQSEIKDRFRHKQQPDSVFGDLLYYASWDDKEGKCPYLCRTAMLDPCIVHFDTIGQAAHALKALQRVWSPYQFHLFRRSSLIQAKLPYINLKARKFPFHIPTSPVGLYTLICDKTMIASAKTSSCLPAGFIQFEEDHRNPPSRAYLKLQESLTMAERIFGVSFPCHGQRCLDAGASPGGWTWVLLKLGCTVCAIDRTVLSPILMANPHVTFISHDAFTLTPQELGKFDWVFSDVICYPERLYSWVQRYLESGLVKNMICTIKMQGAVDWNVLERFDSIPDSCVVHLNYNKHEFTWLHCSAL